jgi:hypothetical protein
LVSVIGGGFQKMQEETAMTIATQLYEKAFHSTRDPRSEVYKAGVLDTLNFKESGSKLPHPYPLGTVEADAWFAGNQEGHSLWRDYQEQQGGNTLENRFRESQHYCNHETGSEDLLSERISQLKSLLTIITGEGFETFSAYNNDIQHNVLWLADSMIDDIHWHFNHPDEHLKETENGK